jgi:phosphomannomutase
VTEAGLKQLRETVTKNRLHIGLACDCDAARYGIIDADGTWLHPNFVLGLAVEHLVKNRGMKGRVARSLMTSHFSDAVAKYHGLTVRETPVGFRNLGSLLRTGQFLVGGEEAGGLSVMGHTPENDGILACLLMAEMVAYGRKPLKKVLAELMKRSGTFLYSKFVMRTDPGVNMVAVIEKLTNRPPLNLAGSSVWRIDQSDGFKFIMKDGSWLGMRPYAGDQAIEIYAEAPAKAKMDTLMEYGRKIMNGKF